MSANNPYAPPQANVADLSPDPSDGSFIESGRSRPIGDGARWIGQAARMFFAPTWWKWLVVLIMFFALSLVIAFIPIINIVNVFFGPVLSAGVAYIADAQRRTGDFAIGDAFKGFNVIGQLLLVGLMMFLASIVVVVCLMFSIGLEGLESFANGSIDPSNPGAILAMMWKGLVVAFILWIPIIAATMFAPALIMLHGLTAFSAMKSSVLGTFKNVLPGILCAILICLLLIASVLTVGVGFLITAPILTLLTYTIYRGIFTEETA